MTEFELDPEKRLWKPNRRSFFFGLGAALIAPMLPSLPAPLLKASTWPMDATLVIGDRFTIAGVYAVNPITYTNTGQLEEFIVTGVQGSTLSISRALAVPLGKLGHVR